MLLTLIIANLILNIINVILIINLNFTVEKRTTEFIQNLIDIELQETRQELEDFFRGDY